MEIHVDGEFRSICVEIVSEGKSEDEWAGIESDDMFQSDSFSGGYDADERAFCFRYYDSERNESWFQLTLAEVAAVANGTKTSFEGSVPD